ncbi:MAG: ATP-dependent RecD-like DNA helicase, partial [Streptococcaceae bacterium]|nr:ATP-dependent RecD-like DNA helicase [Streptococcaceae bacterium]
QLVEEIKGIGFKRADQIAAKLGINHDAQARFRAALIHEVLQTAVTSGDTYVEAKELLTLAIETLENSRAYPVNPESVAQALLELIKEGKVQQDETKIFENSLYFAEKGITSQIKRLLKRKQVSHYDDTLLDKMIDEVEAYFQLNYGKTQRMAIKAAIQSPFFILTGGPGTGKTTIINAILHVFARLNDLSLDPADYRDEIFPFLLAAPTGRAAKRMNETTGLPASTIHRKLGLSAEDDNLAEGAALLGDLLIVDEFSMVDTWLANQLLQAIPQNMQVIFVGDKDQLPSVGPGQVLADLLKITEISKVELKQIYRQGKDSSVITLAHSIKSGIIPADLTMNQSDKSFFSATSELVLPMIEKILIKAKAKGITANDLQVLAPIYRGVAGINALNQMMQAIFNPIDDEGFEVVYKEIKYRRGDKILHLVNEPEQNVFNGDIGFISSIIPARHAESKMDELVLDFDGNEVIYPRSSWHKITLSYAMSIHKAQGSEFELVILPLVSAYHRMLARNLLYTAITRSRSKLILIGELTAFEQAIIHQSNTRRTNLLADFSINSADYLPDEAEENKLMESEETYILTSELIEKGKISTNIGLEDLTPYDFLN